MRARAWAGVAVVAAAFAATALAPAYATAAEPGVPANGRAWELVTPGESVSAIMQSVEAISPSGDRVVVLARGALPGAGASTALTHNLAERRDGGWVTTPLEFPDRDTLTTAGELVQGPKAFSADLSASLWTNALPLLPGQDEPDVGLFRSRADGGYDLLVNRGLLYPPEAALHDASTDLQRVVFSTEEHLLPSDAGRLEGRSIYAIEGSSLRQVDLDDSGAPLSTCGASIDEHNAVTALPETGNAVSRDGGRVFFASRGASCVGPTRVYLREGGATTTEISASRCTRLDCNGESEAVFVGATPSGSAAFLVTSQQLTNDDHDAVADLYRYDVIGGALRRVTGPKPAEFSGSGALPESFVFASEDRSRVYFEFSGRLLPGEGSEHTNIYMADEDGLHLVAGLSAQMQVSADGRFVALFTDAALDTADTDGRLDLYLYDAELKTLRWVSGAKAGNGNGDFDVGTFDLADDGKVFFDTGERLLVEDRNDVTDVYEWDGTTLALVSAGVQGYPAELPASYAEKPAVAATPDGRTVFFRTGATLVVGDRDAGDSDIYAARMGGGLPKSQGLGGCTGGACHEAPGGRASQRRPPTSAPRAKRILLAPIGRSARRQFAASGWIELLAEMPAAGRLSVRAKANLGGTLRTVASVSADARQAGPLRLRLRLSTEARQTLARGSALPVRLMLRLSPAGLTRAVGIVLPGRR